MDELILELHGYSYFLELINQMGDSGKSSFTLADIMAMQDSVIQNVLKKYRQI